MNKKIISILFYIIISIYFLGIVFNTALSYLKKEDNTLKSVTINWEELYPFEDNILNHSSNIIERYNQKIIQITNKIEQLTNENIALKYKISEYYSFILKELKIKKVKGIDYDVIGENNNYSYNFKYIDEQPIVESIKEFDNYLNKKNIDFLYILAPYNYVNTNERNTYKGYIDYTKDNALRLRNSLENSGINYLDLQSIMEEKRINKKEIFYNTDHHWKISGALWGTKEIVRELNERHNFDIDIEKYDISKFDINIYNNSFLGSYGKKATISYMKPDDFELITPNFNTNYNVNIPSLNLELSGSFRDTLIDYTNLKEEKYPEKYYTQNNYAAYGYGDRPLIRIENNDIESKEKVIVLKDSYGDAAIPFLSLGIKNIIVVDLRHFTGSLKSLIDKEKPSLVMILMSGSTQHSIDLNYEEHASFYDFR